MLLSNRCLAFRTLLALSLTTGVATVSTARADDASPAVPPASAPAADAGNPATSEAQIAQWIKELDSDLFATRQSAAQKLFEAGLPAIKPVTEAAGSQSLEESSQAIEILRRMFHSEQTPLHEAAKGALEELAKGDNAAAGRAREALAPPPAPQQNPIPGGPFGPGGFIVPGGGQIQIGINGGNIQIGPGGGMQVIRMRAKVANGVTTTEVEENGKKVKIENDPNNDLEINVTEKVNGQDKTNTYKAKNADELKKKSPEAYKLYEKYGQQGGAIGNIQIRAGAIQAGAVPMIPFGGPPGIQMPALPLGQPNVFPRRGAAEKEAAQQVDEARKLVAEATDGLKQVVQGADAEAAKQKALGQLEDALNKLDSAEQKLKR